LELGFRRTTQGTSRVPLDSDFNNEIERDIKSEAQKGKEQKLSLEDKYSMHSPSKNDEALRRRIVAKHSAEARKKLKPWTKQKKNESFTATPIEVELGDMEGIPVLLATADRDGNFSSEEWDVYLETGKKLVDGTLSQSLNSGVIGALILSMLVPSTMSPADLSEDGWYFLIGENETAEDSGAFEIAQWVLRIIYLVSLNLPIACALASITLAYVITMTLSTWLCSLEAKLQWHIEKITTLRQQSIYIVLMFVFLALSVLTGALLNGPVYGFLGAMPLMLLLYTFTLVFSTTVHSRQRLHDEARALLSSDDDNSFNEIADGS